MSGLRDQCPLSRGGYDTSGGLANYRGQKFFLRGVPLGKTESLNGDKLFAVVKNSTGGTLPAKALVKPKSGTDLKEVGAQATNAAEFAFGVVDEAIDSAGVPDGADFLIQVEGWTYLKTNDAADATNVISEYDQLVASAEDGRVQSQSTSGATTTLANNIQNVIGRAMEAKTTANTAANLLAYVKFTW